MKRRAKGRQKANDSGASSWSLRDKVLLGGFAIFLAAFFVYVARGLSHRDPHAGHFHGPEEHSQARTSPVPSIHR
jgi:hypothetical protein